MAANSGRIGKCWEIEKASSIGDCRSHYQTIGNAGSRKPNLNGVIKQSDDSVIHFQEHRLGPWVGQFGYSAMTLDLPLMPTSESLQIDTSPPSEMEVIRELGFLERPKAAGPCGVLLSFFKSGGQVLVSELTEFLGLIWTNTSGSR